MKEREDFYIDFYDTIKNGYNIEKQYNGITFHDDYDRIVKQISDKAKLRKWVNNGIENITVSPENIQEYLSNGWKHGRIPFSKEHIKELSESHKGYKLTSEQKSAWCSGISTRGRIWIHLNENRKMIKKEDLQLYPEWKLGIKTKIF